MRLGIAVRFVGIIVLIAFIGLQGSAIKTRAFDGKTGHYTVVLKNGEDASLVASQHSGSGIHVEHVNTTPNVSGYSATMPADKADALTHDSHVAYVAYDSEVIVKHSWWETMTLTVDNLIPFY